MERFPVSLKQVSRLAKGKLCCCQSCGGGSVDGGALLIFSLDCQILSMYMIFLVICDIDCFDFDLTPWIEAMSSAST
jgi:hypothetical protein